MSSPQRPPTLPPGSKILPLENGDRLTGHEFERRYEAMPQLKKAELIEGVVHMSSAVRFEQHGEQHFALIGWLAYYRAFTQGTRGADNSTIRLDLDNIPQPDALLLVDPAAGGQAQIDSEGYILHAPELVAEVSASSASYDLHTKLTVYRRNGVLEYLVWRVEDRAIDWFILRQGQYDRLTPDTAGVCRSEVFPGLWLDTLALLRGDLATVLATLQQGLATPEHATFVAGLRARLPVTPP
jgi:Uma2 family endonuclease